MAKVFGGLEGVLFACNLFFVVVVAQYKITFCSIADLLNFGVTANHTQTHTHTMD